MSHITKIKNVIYKDQAALIAALADLGYTAEVHAQPVGLSDYTGAASDHQAEIVVSRDQVGRFSTDWGFRLQPDGSYEALIDFWHIDNREGFMNSLTQRYAYNLALSQLGEQGFNLVEETTGEGGEIHLRLRAAV